MAAVKLTIPGPQNENIVGILQQKQRNPSPGAKIIVMLHGHAYEIVKRDLELTCRGHKNYCYQRYLAEQAPFDSFRFDFRGNGESDRSIHAPRMLKVPSLSSRFDLAGRHGRYGLCIYLPTQRIFISDMGVGWAFER